MKRLELALLIGIIASAILSSFTAFAGECEEIRQGALRLHILANSDTEADQALKLAVRDAVLEGTADIFTHASGKEEIEARAEENLARVEAIARQTLADQGCDYPVQASLVNMYFDTRTYGDETLPAGQYDAVRIVIGEGEGQNWWCVMFPPLCIPAASDTESRRLEQQIHQLGQTPQYQPKFAVVEAVEAIKEKLSDNGEGEAQA